MKKLCRSLKLWFTKSGLKRKYACQLKRTNTLSINTVEGWNDWGRVARTRNLIDLGIEPTEENLLKYQQEINEQVEELYKQYPPEPIPIFSIKSITTNARENEADIEAEKIETILYNTNLGSFPWTLIRKIFNRMQNKEGGELTYTFASLYLLGYINGIRAERSKRRAKAQGFKLPLAM